jgi:hypothetical protein
MATKVARMTPQTEGKIVSAVEEVVDLINDGTGPDDAIVKVAEGIGLPAGHVGLLVNAYNTGRTNRQREAGTGLVEKAADFPLADAAAILGRLYPETVKSAADVQRETSVSADYGMPPTWLVRARDAAGSEKRAHVVPRLVDRPVDPYPGEPAGRIKRAYDASVRRTREVEEARRAFSAEQDGLVECFRKLGAWFADPGNPTVADVRDNVEAIWDRPGAAVLAHLEGTRPGLAKRAALYDSPRTVDRRAEPYRTIAEAVDRADRVRRAGEEYIEAADHAAVKTAEELAPFVPARRGSMPGLLSEDASAEKRAGPYTTALGVQLSRDMLGHIGGNLGVPDKERMVDRSLRQISSPEHEQELRGVHTRSMLHNMLANDPIISGYHPSEVTDAFNQVSQLAPHAASQPAVMGPLLRKWLQQGNLDTFEGDQLVGTEQKLKQIDAPTPGKGLLGHGSTSGGLLAR